MIRRLHLVLGGLLVTAALICGGIAATSAEGDRQTFYGGIALVLMCVAWFSVNDTDIEEDN